MTYQKIIYSLLQRAVKDPEFQDTWGCTADAETAFIPVRETLTPEQADLLDEYLYSRELMSLTLAVIAWQMGREYGSQAQPFGAAAPDEKTSG